MPINLDKIRKEIEKGENIEDKVKAYYDIKDFISTLVAAEQKAKEEEANKLQNIHDRINNV